MLLAAIGIFREPDLFSRMQAATKASTLGIACTMLAVAVYFEELGVTSRALLIICFFFLTGPIAAHRLGRAAYFVGVSLWPGTTRDELREYLEQHDAKPPPQIPASQREHPVRNAPRPPHP
jgi:multicomponent Na+:H+ antiporter subunit G